MGLRSLIKKNKHKNSKPLYYLRNFVRYYTPKWLCRMAKPFIMRQLSREDAEYIRYRVDYYNKLTGTACPTEGMTTLADFKLPKKKKGVYANRVYFFDSYQYTRYFSDKLKAAFLFGDITYTPDVPSITKSRPIDGDNANSVLLNLDKVRHFMFVNDNRKFADKKDMLIGRAYIRLPKRIDFYQKYFDHPMCDLGQINTNYVTDPRWIVKPMAIDDHLDYKFILCLEGNDVASNLKWVMSSNSLAVMPKPTYETWFMEGTLIPNVHYVEIKPDYSDLEERLRYYCEHTDEAQKIIDNAHKYVSQFRNKKREDLISILVLEKYFSKTNQQ